MGGANGGDGGKGGSARAAMAQFGFSWSKCVSVFGVTIVLSREEREGAILYIDWSRRARSVGGGAARLLQVPHRSGARLAVILL